MNGGESDGEKEESFKAKIKFSMKSQYNYQPLFA